MMPRDFDTLRDVLWTKFEKAVERQSQYEDRSNAGSSTPTNFAIDGRNAIANLASALVNLEREARERNSENNPIRLPGKGA